MTIPLTNTPSPAPGGSLILAGTGLRGAAQLTLETIGWIESADVLAYCVTDPLATHWLLSHAPPGARLLDLSACYRQLRPRADTYADMTAALLAPARAGHCVVGVFYGHPGVFATPAHRAIAQARTEGIRAAMLPGVSAEDCLFAEIGFDPARQGCHSYEATDFLLRTRPPQTSSHLVLWQIGCIGEWSFHPAFGANPAGLALLSAHLLRFYPPAHGIFHYRASHLPGHPSLIEYLQLADLPRLPSVNPMSTLYLPPVAERPIDPEMARALGLDLSRPDGLDTSPPLPAAPVVPPVRTPPPDPSAPSPAAYLHTLACNPARLALHLADPTRSLHQVSPPLTPAQRHAILSHDPTVLLRELSAANPQPSDASQPDNLDNSVSPAPHPSLAPAVPQPQAVHALLS